LSISLSANSSGPAKGRSKWGKMSTSGLSNQSWFSEKIKTNLSNWYKNLQRNFLLLISLIQIHNKIWKLQGFIKEIEDACNRFTIFIQKSYFKDTDETYQCQSNSFLKCPQCPLFEHMRICSQWKAEVSEWYISHDSSRTYKATKYV
jgi:hypothetical protein